MKKAATVAICSAAIASSGAIKVPFLRQQCLLTRGGAKTSAESQKVNDNSTSLNGGIPLSKKSKRRKKKSQSKKNSPESVDEKVSTQQADSTKEDKQEEAEGSNAKPDPFLEELIKQEDYYAILGVSKTCTGSQITKAYRKRAVRTHPDKTGGDRRAFDKVSEAYDILSDEEKRNVYDRFGKKGLQRGGSGVGAGFNKEDLFRQFFGQRQQYQTPQFMRYQLEVSLEDLYKGITQTITVDMAGGRKRVEVHIPKGTSSGESITLSGELEFPSGGAPGDLIFILQQRPHHTFTRKKNDLAVEMTITLEEAIFGVKRDIHHLDGHRLFFQSAQGSDRKPLWIQTGDVQVLKGKGMPIQNAHDEFGDLYVQYRVEVPKSTNQLTDEERQQLSELLGKLQDRPEVPSTEKRIKRQAMEKSKLSDFGRSGGRFHEDNRSNRRSSHFWSSGQGPGAHPFFAAGSPFPEEEGSNVQCQQM